MPVIVRNKIYQILTVIILILGIGYFAGTIHIKQQMQQREVVNLNDSEDQKILFYREDCPDCKRVFPNLYIKSLLDQELILVNLNQPKNRKYIQQYQLKEVPIIFNGKRSYSGIDTKKMKHILKD